MTAPASSKTGSSLPTQRATNRKNTMQRIHTEDDKIESEIQAKGKTASRITPDHIESTIEKEYFFTAGEGAREAGYIGMFSFPHSLNLLTICVLVLRAMWRDFQKEK